MQAWLSRRVIQHSLNPRLFNRLFHFFAAMQAWLSRRVIQHDPNPRALTIFPTFYGNAGMAFPPRDSA